MLSQGNAREAMAQASERQGGESISSMDVERMKTRAPCPLQTGNRPSDSFTVKLQPSTLSNGPIMLEYSLRMYINLGRFAGKSIGPTRAALHIRKQNLHRNIAVKEQMLSRIKAEIGELHTRIESQFGELNSTLKTHPNHPKLLVQYCAK